MAESTHRALLETVPLGILIHRDGTLLHLNRSARRMLGLDERTELAGFDLGDVVRFEDGSPPDDVSAGATPQRVLLADGRALDIDILSGALEFEGHPAVQWVLVDVTERRQIEERLRSGEARYRAVVEEQAAFIVRWLPDGTLTFVNQAYCDFFGGTRQRWIGCNIFSAMSDDDRQNTQRKLNSLSPRAPLARSEHRILRPDNSIAWQHWTDHGVFDESGRLIEVQSVGHDITENKRTERRLRESEERYRILVENAPEAIVVFDVGAGRFVDVNRNAVEMFGIGREQLLQMSPGDVSPPQQPDGRDSHEAAVEMVSRALSGETPVFPWVHRHASGKELPTEIRLVRLPSSQRALIRGSITDVTERKALEERLIQSQKLEAIGRLAGGIAHDFNNLLTAINGYAELALSRTEAVGAVRDDLVEIDKAGQRAAALTRQLLAFGRKQIVQPRPVDLGALVDEASRMLVRVIGEDVRLEIQRDVGLAPIEADPTQIEQIILNLAVNAREAMPRGGTLTIETRNSAPTEGGSAELRPDEYVALIVSDTGVGMDRDTLEHVFEPFFTTRATGDGTGLGLATVYGIVKQSGGFIWVRSEVDRGTTFTILLPRSRRSPARQRAEAPRDDRGAETILLVEDEPLVRDLARQGLQRAGYRVLSAGDGPGALHLLDDHEGAIDLLITDVVMPGMSGHELARRVTTARPQTRVLFVSGYTDDSILRHGVQQQEVALLQKPFSIQDLCARVRDVIGREVASAATPPQHDDESRGE